MLVRIATDLPGWSSDASRLAIQRLAIAARYRAPNALQWRPLIADRLCH
jgi:hypothetical protein